MRIVIVWVNIPNYIASSIEELASMGCELLVVQINSNDESNKTFKFNKMSNVTFIDFSNLKHDNKEESLINEIIAFDPSYVLLSFYNLGIYYKIAKHCKQAGIYVVAASDSFFEGTFRQVMRIILSRLGFHKNYDAIFVPGYRAYKYAKLLNFKDKKIIQGLYTSNNKLYRAIGFKKHKDAYNEWPHVFIFTGQLIYRKGFDTLLQAFELYRKQVKDPWELWIIGDGPLKTMLDDCKGITYFKSLSSKECSEKLGMAGCFILPSIIDHWGLVIHEATCAGLPIIASSQCGSTVELVQNFHNGLTIPHSDIAALVTAMNYISENDKIAMDMGANSLKMSERYSTLTWAKKMINEIPMILGK
jgi:glycosyltransferase involved in cell wall biosynthesis